MRSALRVTRPLLAVFIVLAPVFTPARAMAQVSAPLAAPPTAVHAVWYGYETLLVDGASMAVGIGVGLARPDAGALVFAGGYTLGGPTVHLAHGERLKALESLGLRLAAPATGLVLGSLVGLAVGSQQTGSSDAALSPAEAGLIGGAVIGAAVGGLTAVALDAALLARTPAMDDAPQSGAVTWAPAITRLPGGGMTVGVTGTF